jgi:hypothetical protein
MGAISRAKRAFAEASYGKDGYDATAIFGAIDGNAWGAKKHSS